MIQLNNLKVGDFINFQRIHFSGIYRPAIRQIIRFNEQGDPVFWFLQGSVAAYLLSFTFLILQIRKRSLILVNELGYVVEFIDLEEYSLSPGNPFNYQKLLTHEELITRKLIQEFYNNRREDE